MIGNQPPHRMVEVSVRTLADALCQAVQTREIGTQSIITEETSRDKNESAMIYHNRLRGVAGANGRSCKSCERLAESLLDIIWEINQALEKNGYVANGNRNQPSERKPE